MSGAAGWMSGSPPSWMWNAARRHAGIGRSSPGSWPSPAAMTASWSSARKRCSRRILRVIRPAPALPPRLRASSSPPGATRRNTGCGYPLRSRQRSWTATAAAGHVSRGFFFESRQASCLALRCYIHPPHQPCPAWAGLVATPSAVAIGHRTAQGVAVVPYRAAAIRRRGDYG